MHNISYTVPNILNLVFKNHVGLFRPFRIDIYFWYLWCFRNLFVQFFLYLILPIINYVHMVNALRAHIQILRNLM